MNESKEFPTKKGYFSDGQIELPMPTQESPSQTLSIALFMKALQFFCATFMFVRLHWRRTNIKVAQKNCKAFIKSAIERVWLGDSCVGIGSSIWPSEKYPFFVGNSFDSFIFVRCPTHNVLDNDGAFELSSCLGSRSRRGVIALRKIKAFEFRIAHARPAPYQAPFATRH